MRIYICRHGKAERDSDSGSDFDRRLKKKGHRQAAHIGDQLSRATPRPHLVLVSPLVRAQETAAGILENLQADRRDEDRLSTAHRVGDILDVITELAGDLPKGSGAVLVGHNPDMSLAASMLLHGPGAQGAIALRTGQCVAITIDPAGPVGSGSDPVSYRLED